MAKTSDSQCAVPASAAAAGAASGNLLETHVLASHPRLAESEILAVVPSNLGLISDSDAQLKFEDHKVNGKQLNLEKKNL